jgi:hypothetical protein
MSTRKIIRESIRNLGKLERGAVYIIQIKGLKSPEHMKMYSDGLEGVTKQCGAQFIIFGPEMDVLNPINCKAILIDVLREWETNKPRISLV